MSHLKPRKSTMISYCIPLKVTLVTVPTSCPCSTGTMSISSGRMTTSTGSLGAKPPSTQGNSRPYIFTTLSRTMTPFKILLSPIKSATKAFFGSL